MDVAATPATTTTDRQASPTYVEKTDPIARQRQHRDTSRVQGWGADLDPKDRPGVPMERTPPRLPHLHWDAPEQQAPHIKVHHSTERPGITPVFGTSVPPSGLSGAMRDVAFRYSENDLRHWMILLGADRVNVVEGLLDDLAHGQVPNLWREMGLASEWRYNRASFIRKAAIGTALLGVAVYLLRRHRRD